MADQKPSAGLFSRHEAIGRRQQDPTEVDLNSTDLLREEEEADRQYLIEEVTQEPETTTPAVIEPVHLTIFLMSNTFNLQSTINTYITWFHNDTLLTRQYLRYACFKLIPLVIEYCS